MGKNHTAVIKIDYGICHHLNGTSMDKKGIVHNIVKYSNTSQYVKWTAHKTNTKWSTC